MDFTLCRPCPGSGRPVYLWPAYLDQTWPTAGPAPDETQTARLCSRLGTRGAPVPAGSRSDSPSPPAHRTDSESSWLHTYVHAWDNETRT